MFKDLYLLSEKEMFFCSLEKEDFKKKMDRELNEMKGEYNVDAINIESVILLVNEQRLDRILELERKSDWYNGALSENSEGFMMLPFYLYYDEDQFIKFVQDNDISTLCRKYRIVILVGMKNLEDFFCHLDVIYPNFVLGDNNKIISKKLSEIETEKGKILQHTVNELFVYYQTNEWDIKHRILSGSAKICILKNYFEPKRFKELYRQLKNSLEEVGYSVEINEERGAIFRTHELLNIYRHRPDIVFQINKTKNGRTYQGEALHLECFENLIYINWIQDVHPSVLNREYALSLKKNDFIFSLFDENILRKYGYPESNVIYGGIMPADEKNFCIHSLTKEEHEKYDYDLCFLGSIFDEEYAVKYIYSELLSYLSYNQIGKVCDALFEILEGMYNPHTQEYITGLKILSKYADQLQKDLQCDDLVRGYIERVFGVVRYNSLRKLILKQLAGQRKYKIILYGVYDVKIDGVDFGGFISNREEMSKAIQCCKALIQINSDATMNQRVVEGLLSHTMALVYKMNAEDDMSNIAHYLDEYEGICYFKSKKELLEKIELLLKNEEFREQITECGYQKAGKILTTDYVFCSMMENIQEKIRNNM